MKLASPLIRGTLVKRYRRFLVDVRLDNGSVVTAHCPNSGSMVGCCEQGRPVLLSDSKNLHRRHRLTWELINMNGTWVGVNPAVPRKVLDEGIRSGAVPSFAGYNEILRDATYGSRGKVDFMLLGMEQNCFINIHGVTWSEGGVALFPDAASERPKRSLRELAEVAKQGHRAVAFFLVLRGDCETFRPAEGVDREYLRAILDAHSAGVELMVYRADVKPDEILLGVPIPYSLV